MPAVCAGQELANGMCPGLLWGVGSFVLLVMDASSLAALETSAPLPCNFVFINYVK